MPFSITDIWLKWPGATSGKMFFWGLSVFVGSERRQSINLFDRTGCIEDFRERNSAGKRYLVNFVVWKRSFVFAITSSDAAQNDRLNILFLLRDNQLWYALGYAANAIVHTPNMDRLARSGMRFSNAFVTTSICAASRANI